MTGNFTFKYSDGTAVSRTAVQPNKAIVFTGADQATSYQWDFGDGSALAYGSPKEHTFIRGGNFTVKLTVARSGVPGTVTTPSPLVFTVLAPPDPLLWVAAGMAYADGGNGARWQSDLSIYNPGTQTATVSLGFVSGAQLERREQRHLGAAGPRCRGDASRIRTSSRTSSGSPRGPGASSSSVETRFRLPRSS